jgi:hypothetical protein
MTPVPLTGLDSQYYAESTQCDTQRQCADETTTPHNQELYISEEEECTHEECPYFARKEERMNHAHAT